MSCVHHQEMVVDYYTGKSKNEDFSCSPAHLRHRTFVPSVVFPQLEILRSLNFSFSFTSRALGAKDLRVSEHAVLEREKLLQPGLKFFTQLARRRHLRLCKITGPHARHGRARRRRVPKHGSERTRQGPYHAATPTERRESEHFCWPGMLSCDAYYVT